MDKRKTITLIIMLILMIGMMYFAYLHLSYQKDMIHTYEMAKEACEVDSFDYLCRSCYAGLAGWTIQ